MALRCTPPAKLSGKVLGPPCSVSVQSAAPTTEPPVKVLSFPRSTLSPLKDLPIPSPPCQQFLGAAHCSFSPLVDFILTPEPTRFEPVCRLSSKNRLSWTDYPLTLFPRLKVPREGSANCTTSTRWRRYIFQLQNSASRLRTLKADCAAAYCKWALKPHCLPTRQPRASNQVIFSGSHLPISASTLLHRLDR